MKRLACFLLTVLLALSMVQTAYADEGEAIYNGSAGEFIFEPGSEYSPTDLFPNFKDVMPGDVLTQQITVRNDQSKNVKVRIYMRALGAHEGSAEFLSQLQLTVEKADDTLLFDAPADQTAQLTDWVYLGTLYSGGECDLIVTLAVPVSLDNEFKDLVGYLDWEFAVEELPTQPSDPKPPSTQAPGTGDTAHAEQWLMLLALSALMCIVLVQQRRKSAMTIRKGGAGLE